MVAHPTAKAGTIQGMAGKDVHYTMLAIILVLYYIWRDLKYPEPE
jgi:hypothetical protein